MICWQRLETPNPEQQVQKEPKLPLILSKHWEVDQGFIATVGLLGTTVELLDGSKVVRLQETDAQTSLSRPKFRVRTVVWLVFNALGLARTCEMMHASQSLLGHSWQNRDICQKHWHLRFCAARGPAPLP